MGVFSRGVGLSNVTFPASKPKIIFTTLPPPDTSQAADRGLVTIQAGGATCIDLNHSFSKTVRLAVEKEITRTVDRVRIKNPEKPNQYVDVERPKQMTLGPTGTQRVPGVSPRIIHFAPQPEAEHIEILEEDVVIDNPEYESPTPSSGGDGGSGAP